MISRKSVHSVTCGIVIFSMLASNSEASVVACGTQRILTRVSTTQELTMGIFQLTNSSKNYGNYSGYVGLGNFLKTELSNELRAAVRAEFGKIENFQGSDASIEGPFTFQLGGRPILSQLSESNKNNIASLTNLNFFTGDIRIGASFKKSKNILGIGSVSARCNIYVKLANPKFIGLYDVVKNQVEFSNSRITTTHSEDCSTSFSWVPIIGPAIDNLLTTAVGVGIQYSIKVGMKRALSQVFSLGDFFGLKTAIPAGRFVHNGFDYGVNFRDSISKYILKNLLIIQVSQRTNFDFVESSGKKSNVLVSVEFRGSEFRITETAQYTPEYVCSFNGSYLHSPPVIE